LVDVPATRWRALLGGQLAVAGLVVLIASCLVRRRRVPVLAGGLALVAIGAGVGVFPLVVDAYPTTYKRPLPTYHVASIASGMTIYREHCAGCHGATGAGGPLADLRSPPTSRRHAGEIFWLISRGIPERGMPDFGIRLGEEVIAAPIHASSEAIRELGSAPPVLFPVVTDGSGDIVTTYGMFAPGPHAEILIDRQGYIRAIWRGDGGGMPRASMVQAQVE